MRDATTTPIYIKSRCENGLYALAVWAMGADSSCTETFILTAWASSMRLHTTIWFSTNERWIHVIERAQNGGKEGDILSAISCVYKMLKTFTIFSMGIPYARMKEKEKWKVNSITSVSRNMLSILKRKRPMESVVWFPNLVWCKMHMHTRDTTNHSEWWLNSFWQRFWIYIRNDGGHKWFRHIRRAHISFPHTSATHPFSIQQTCLCTNRSPISLDIITHEKERKREKHSNIF